MRSVNRGIALLDAKVPGWFNKVDPKEIDLYSSFNCILGQIFGNYQRGLWVLPNPGYGHYNRLEPYGFNPRRGLHWLSKRAWRKAIKARVKSAEAQKRSAEAQKRAEALKAKQAADLAANLERFVASVKEDPFWDYDYIPEKETVDA